MSEQTFVSVVTPFYNTAEYLAQCIESVLAQTHRNFEYVLVDNQSTDGSGEIAARYARQDNRVRLLRTERFLTQIQNYNFTLSQISGESRYCKMVQADDWIFPRCLEEMVAAADEHPTAGVVSSYLVAETELRGTGLAPDVRATFLTGRDIARRHLLGSMFLFGTPTTVLYRADLVRGRNPFYEEGRYHPDTEVVYDLLRDHDFVFVHQLLSFMRQQEGSITWKARNLNALALDRMIVTKRFGPVFLTPAEYQSCMAGVSTWFYSNLARQALLSLPSGAFLRDRDFWERQRVGLAGVGERIRVAPFMKGMATVVLRNVADPIQRVRRACGSGAE